MIQNVQGASFPSDIPSLTAWDAFQHVFNATDWRLQIHQLEPISFTIEHDDAFDAGLQGWESWRPSLQARAWLANRVVQLADAIGKTYVRRLSLQVPDTADGPMAEALTANLKQRVEDTIRRELMDHFDTSIPEWERDALDLTSRMDDGADQWRMIRYLGLDQRVSVDAARKAIRYVFYLTHWYLTDHGEAVVLTPDWRFERYRSLRDSTDETQRARSLVARCFEVMCENHEQTRRSGQEVAPMIRNRLKADIDRLFDKDGVWGLIDLTLPRDRVRYRLSPPGSLEEPLQEIMDRQRKRMEAWGR